MKEKLFIDFDGTLFDTEAFKGQMYDIFVKAGFELDEIKSTYNAECLDYKYSPIGQMERLKKIHSFDREAADQRFKKLYASCDKFLYDDSVEFLNGINRDKYGLDLLTLGDTEFQKTKVDHSGIAKYFDDIYYTEVQKWDYLDRLVDRNENFIVIDDRGDALTEIKKKFKHSLAIHIERPIEDKDDPFLSKKIDFSGINVKNLKQARQYL